MKIDHNLDTYGLMIFVIKENSPYWISRDFFYYKSS